MHIEDDAYWSILEEKETLAFYSEFKVHEGKMFFQILYPLSDTGKMLYANQSSKEVKYFNTPHGISRILPGNSSIYGIYQDLDQGLYSLITLDISSLL
jgi:hypothetical protein